jgi:hypothetical protein
MNNTFLSIIKKIISEQGESVLVDAKRIRGYLSDFAANEPKAQKNAFVKCLEYGFYNELKDSSADSRSSVKGRLAQKLCGEEGLDLTLCAGAINLLEAAVFGDAASVQPEVSTADNEWVTVVEQKKAEKAESSLPPSETPSVPFPAADTPSAPLRPSDTGSEDEASMAVFKEKLKKTKRGLIAAIIAGAALLILSIVFGVMWSQTDSMKWYYFDQYYSLNSRYDTLLNHWTISVNSIGVANSNANGEWINDPGEELTASEIRFLSPVIIYDSSVSQEVTLYVKIIDPNGQLMRGTSSPSGYSFSTTQNITAGRELSLGLSGWGNENQSNYYPGSWTVEVWYNGSRYGSTTVTLN